MLFSELTAKIARERSESRASTCSQPNQEMKNQKRKTKAFWAVVGGDRVVHVTGYYCEGMTGYYWCPAIGMSLREGAHLFETEDEAVRKAIEEGEAKLAYSVRTIAILRERLEEVGRKK